MIVIVF